MIGDNVRDTEHPRIMAADEVCLTWPEMERVLLQLDAYCSDFAVQEIVDLLQAAPTEFNHSSVTDLVAKARKTEVIDINAQLAKKLWVSSRLLALKSLRGLKK
ncbi:hypothetical protein RDV63_00060 [Rheinheimera sp. MMS21-TC3]|nr:hypothetical protein [Rheinheimera sp. MMS21-TC3]WNO59398.1 hypothetical protein RDV63_00060 [Rheinheimera sp. MMS21-TC3]